MSDDLMYCGPVFHRMLTWQVEELPKWSGRDWRRIKREWRKFVRPRRAK